MSKTLKDENLDICFENTTQIKNINTKSNNAKLKQKQIYLAT